MVPIKYKGTELVNCSPPPIRKGPYVRFPHGRYEGATITDIIRSDPRYFMYAVKDWLNVTPEQASLFTLVTDGEIPLRYISQDTPLDERSIRKGDLDSHLYWTNQDLLPNYDFDPSEAPDWWPEYKERSKGLTRPSERIALYQEIVFREFKKIRDSLV